MFTFRGCAARQSARAATRLSGLDDLENKSNYEIVNLYMEIKSNPRKRLDSHRIFANIRTEGEQNGLCVDEI